MYSPKVSVTIVTYNQARFIAQAIESVLAQRTSFPFEVIIGEDESSDGTREIVQAYASSHPEKIRPLFHTRADNVAYQGQPTGQRNFVECVRAARGKYVAHLDGDDYWLDPSKLQRQADFLEAHPECSTCFCPARTIDENGEPVQTAPPLRVTRPVYTLAQFLQGEFRPRLSTAMFRRGLFEDFPEWYLRLPAGDYPLHVLNGRHGGFGLIEREMVAYRIHGGGIWTQGYSEEDFWRTAPPEQQRQRLRVILELQTMARRELGREYEPILRPLWLAHLLRLANAHWALRDWPAMRGTLRQALRARAWSENGGPVWLLQALLVSHFPFLSRHRGSLPPTQAA